MNPEERAEKIADCKNDSIFTDNGTTLVDFESLREQIASQIREAVEEALLNSPTVSKFAYDKAVKEAYEDAAKIAERHQNQCEHLDKICCDSIADDIRARAKETK